MSQVFGHDYALHIVPFKDSSAVVDRPTGYEDNGSECLPISSYAKYISAQPVPYIATADFDSGGVLIQPPLQLDAVIKYGSTSNSTGQTATIKVHNLSKDTLGKIKAKDSVILKSGYVQDSDLPICFVGTIEQVFTADQVTTLLCKEGGNVQCQAYFVAAYPKETTYEYVIGRFIAKFAEYGIPLGGKNLSNRFALPLKEYYTVRGSLFSEMTRLCDSVDLKWYLSKGKLYIEPKEVDLSVKYITLESNKVIGKLSLNDNKSGMSTNDVSNSTAGITAEIFHNCLIGLETHVVVNYGDYAGTYKPEEVTHTLNWKSGPWKTTIKAQAAKNE